MDILKIVYFSYCGVANSEPYDTIAKQPIDSYGMRKLKMGAK